MTLRARNAVELSAPVSDPPPISLGIPPDYSFTRVARLPPTCGDGAIIAFHLSQPLDFRWVQRMTEVVRRMRARYPRVVLAGVLNDVLKPRQFPVLKIMGTAGMRIWLDEPLKPAKVRAALGKAGLLASDAERWLEVYLRPRGLIEGGTVQALSKVLAGLHLNESTRGATARWTRRLGLPPVRKWSSAGKVIRALISLQADVDLSVESAALKAGYSAGASLSHACARLFGVPPSATREIYGWEWLLYRFMKEECP